MQPLRADFKTGDADDDKLLYHEALKGWARVKTDMELKRPMLCGMICFGTRGEDGSDRPCVFFLVREGRRGGLGDMVDLGTPSEEEGRACPCTPSAFPARRAATGRASAFPVRRVVAYGSLGEDGDA